MVSIGLRTTVVIVLSLLLALAALSLAPQPAAPGAPATAGNAIALKAPPFVQPVYAQEGTDPATAADAAAAPLGFPQDEAGIAAYFKSATPVNLNDVRSVFRVIEAQTADYIIGSVPVPDYPDSEDVHAYVHKDGWFLTYYLSADPVGKIFNWRKYHTTGRENISTKLEDTIAILTGQAGVSFATGATHYDFRYPNATHLMMITEWTTSWDTFEVKLPGTFTYYERSWSLGSNQDAVYYLNGVRIAATPPAGWATREGTFTAAQLLPDQFHTIGIDAVYDDNYGYAGLALVYRVP